MFKFPPAPATLEAVPAWCDELLERLHAATREPDRQRQEILASDAAYAALECANLFGTPGLAQQIGPLPFSFRDPPLRLTQAVGIVRLVQEDCQKKLAETVALSQDGGERPRQPAGKRRKRSTDQVLPLTDKQLEAVQIVGECKGNVSEAARRLGKDPQTVRQHYGAGMRKLGKTHVKHGTQRLRTDQRGQSDVTAADDQRG